MEGEVQTGNYTVKVRLGIKTKPGGKLPCKEHVEGLISALLLSPPTTNTDAPWDVTEVEIIGKEANGSE